MFFFLSFRSKFTQIYWTWFYHLLPKKKCSFFFLYLSLCLVVLDCYKIHGNYNYNVTHNNLHKDLTVHIFLINSRETVLFFFPLVGCRLFFDGVESTSSGALSVSLSHTLSHSCFSCVLSKLKFHKKVFVCMCVEILVSVKCWEIAF